MKTLSAHSKLLLSEKAHQQGSEHASDYLSNLALRRVSPSKADITLMDAFSEPLPDGPSNPLDVVDMLHRFGSPATVATAGGRFFGLVVGGSLPACVGARALMSAWDQLATTEITSPISAHLERVSSDWLLNLFNLPRSSSVGFVTGTTMGNFVSLAAARHRLLSKLNWNVEKQGLFGAPSLRVVASREVHFTVEKVLAMLGIGTDLIEYVPVDSNGAMKVSELPELDERTIVLTQAGNVNSGAIDPIGKIVEKARSNGAWVHVDGAFGLWAAASSRKKHLIAGFEEADSWVTDGHKWLNTPYDSGIAICRHPEDVHKSMATVAPYFEVSKNIDAKDMMPELSRAARGVDIWAALKSLGRHGVQELVNDCCDHARLLADELEAMGFEVLNDVVLNQVVATYSPDEARVSDIVEWVVNSGIAWFGVTRWQGRQAFRISVSSWVTCREDVEETVNAIKSASDELGLFRS
ncbi:pyridoxal-dependent decarboxylase [Arenicella sp. 4NH20-0111]|uniref:pyridoxal phosphate-dependent decarboxylase family protein n=1 Tax=Arenicella sp. 4NH20-0111 TaxID=3127648 RepID=UPI00310962CA